jgi:SAM-dependent methyltransferase
LISDFHAYERELARGGLIPLLAREGIDLAGKAVLDVGCGYGGVLAALAEAQPLSRAQGVDLDRAMIESGRGRCPAGVSLEARDFFGLEAGGFDLILLRDVLEHMPDAQAALRKAASLLAPGGSIFASFAPFYSPFGGHQHNGAGFFSNVPWLQALPESWFRRALRLKGNSYKSGEGLAEDMESVLRSRLTVRRFRASIRAAGLRETYLTRYLSRPDYRIKFGLPEIGFPGVPILEELACTGVEALMKPMAEQAP